MRFKMSVLILVASLLMGIAVHAQNKKEKKEEKKEASPVQEGEKDIDIPPPPPIAVPVIDFDTSTVVEDSYTALIRKLLQVTNARQTDIDMAGASLRQSLGPALTNPNTSSMMQKFYERFMYEMEKGRAARWLENVYIRNYRELFTAEEIQALIDFYSSSAGQKSLSRTKILLQNVSQEARKIGAYLGQDIMQSVLSEELKK